MKTFVCCLTAALLSSAFAVTKFEENTVKTEGNIKPVDKSSDSKLKRDASHLVGSYHGSSFKYLPPASISSSYDSYVGNSVPSSLISGAYKSGKGKGYRPDSTLHFGDYAHGQHNGGFNHGLRYVSKHNYLGSGGHHGLGYISGSIAGHGFVPQIKGIKDGTSSFSHKEFSGVHGNSYALGHEYSTPENGYKSNFHFMNDMGYKGKPIVAGGYHYSNGHNGNLPPVAFKGFNTGYSLSSSKGLALPESHYDDHVHNGVQAHTYFIPSESSNFGSGRHEVNELPVNSYLPPVPQHPIPSSSYGTPIINLGDNYKNKYQQQTSLAAEHNPSYAAGHKGLGHFSFTANKPQALHTTISGSSLQQPSFSNAPFKPSTFLGVNYEKNSHENFPNQQYVPSSSIISNPSGYDYSSAQETLATYQQANYPQSLEVQSASKPEPDSTYLPPSSNESSFNEISSPNGNYLPPTNAYEVSYSH